jgi:hypothetical protein
VAEFGGYAATALAALPVKDAASMAGYNRTALFLPNGELRDIDTDRNGCDQRNDTLALQLTEVRLADDDADDEV